MIDDSSVEVKVENCFISRPEKPTLSGGGALLHDLLGNNTFWTTHSPSSRLDRFFALKQTLWPPIFLVSLLKEDQVNNGRTPFFLGHGEVIYMKTCAMPFYVVGHTERERAKAYDSIMSNPGYQKAEPFKFQIQLAEWSLDRWIPNTFHEEV